MSNNKQTAVEQLFHKLWKTSIDKFTWYAILEEHIAIHKQEIIDARVNGVCEGIDIGSLNVDSYPDIIGYKPITEDISKNHEQYYNETFGGKNE